MVTLKNIDSATNASWRYPTKKHVFPETHFLDFCTWPQPNAHFLCKMHSFILNGNCLVELNLTSKRNSGWEGGFIIHPDQGVWS